MNKIIAIIIFVLALCVGGVVALHKPFWMDELHTQYDTIRNYSVGETILGRSFEGNNAPFFYLGQKILYKFKPIDVLKEDREAAIWYEPFSQVYLRLTANIAVSLMLAGMFYFFACRFSWGIGMYALLLALTSPMVWLHWAEARPYAWMMSLAFFYIIYVVKVFEDGGVDKLWKRIFLLELVMVFTSYLMLIPMIAGHMVLASRGMYKNRRLWVLSIIPLAIGLMYRIGGEASPYVFDYDWNYLWDNVSVLRLGFMGAVTGVLALLLYKSLWAEGKELFASVGVFVLTLGASVMLLLYLRTTGPINHATELAFNSRFLIFLSPLAIVAQTFIVSIVFKNVTHKRWMLWNLSVVILGFLIIDFFRLCVRVFV